MTIVRRCLPLPQLASLAFPKDYNLHLVSYSTLSVRYSAALPNRLATLASSIQRTPSASRAICAFCQKVRLLPRCRQLLVWGSRSQYVLYSTPYKRNSSGRCKYYVVRSRRGPAASGKRRVADHRPWPKLADDDDEMAPACKSNRSLACNAEPAIN